MIETRTNGSPYETRAVQGIELRAAKDDEPAKIVGYAAVFDSLSEELWGFREIILPGAFDRALKEKHDVRALVEHDSRLILGRTKSGTLGLDVDKVGLRSSITLPDTQAARDAQTSIERGDIDGMSFAFVPKTEEWRLEDGIDIREIHDVDLYDVSVVAYPAYPETSVSLRVATRAVEHCAELQLARKAAGARVPFSIRERQQMLAERR